MADDSSPPDEIKQLDARLNYLESVARETVARLYAVEKHLGLVFRAVPRELQTPAQRETVPRQARLQAIEETLKTAVPPVVPEKRPDGEAVQTHSQITTPRAPEEAAQPSPVVPGLAGGQPESDPSRPSGAPRPPDRRGSVIGAPVPQGPPPPTPRARAAAPAIAPGSFSKAGGLEARIGGSWFNRIGIIAIFLGVTFFLKYAVDSQWIGPAGRVLIGAAIGVGFLILGERLRKLYPSYAYGLTGGGIAVLYAAIWFASGNKYGLLSQPLAFALMASVTATASLLSARYSALPIAVLALIGGFLTPILLSTGVDNEPALFSYIALLDLGVLALAYSKQWRSLNYMAFISTVLMFAGWMLAWWESYKLWTTILFLTIFFIIFALLAVLYNVVNRRSTSWFDLAMVFSNALLYFGTCYSLLDDKYYGMLGAFALLVAAFYLGLGYLTYRRDSEDRLLVFTFLGLGFLFSVLAVPIQFDQHWVTMGWAIEGAVMTWIGLRANDRTSRYAAFVVFAIGLTHWVMVDVHDFAYVAGNEFVPLFNRRALSGAVMVVALAAAAYFYKRHGKDIDGHSNFAGFFTLAANSLAVTLLTIDANDYFEQRKALASGRELVSSLGNSKALTLTALWTVYGVGALFVGIARRLRSLRYLALLLLAGATVKVLLVDLSYYNSSLHSLAFNQTFGAFILLIGALASGAYFYSKADDLEGEERGFVLGVLIAAANILGVIALSAEAIGYFDRGQVLADGETVARLENAKQLALTAVWTIFGATALTVGVRRNSVAVRIGSFVLLALATAKSAVIDLQYYNAGWHKLLINPTFAAFALLILAFAVCIWSYAHSDDIDRKESAAVIPTLLIAANLLALVALSSEASGYFYRARANAGAHPLEEISRLSNNEQFILSALWITYGVVALGIAILRGRKSVRLGALILLTIATIKVLVVDSHFYDASWHTLIINQTFGAFALLIAALATGVWFYAHAADKDAGERSTVLPVLIVSSNLLAIIAFSLEALGHYAVMMRAAGLQSEDLANLKLAQQLSISVVWTIYGGAMLTVGIARRSKLLRVMALLLLGLTIFKVFLFDLSSLEKLYRIISFIVLGMILLAVSFLYQRYRQRVAELIGEGDAAAQVVTE
jgi:uncharacterized membrane protein